MAGPDPRDRHSLPLECSDGEALERDLAGARVAWLGRVGDVPVDPEVAAIARRAVAVFEDLGCGVKELVEPLEDPYPVLDILWSVAMAAVHRDDLDAVRDLLDPGRLTVIEHGLRCRCRLGACRAQSLRRPLAATIGAIRLRREPDHAGDGLCGRCRSSRSDRWLSDDIPELDPLHLSVQHQWPTSDQRAVWVDAGGTAGRPADRRALAR